MPTSAVEKVSRDYLLAGDWDIIVNVLDASQMARSLELTLELLDLESPMVVCLNMMDEAARKGMAIDTPRAGTRPRRAGGGGDRRARTRHR